MAAASGWRAMDGTADAVFGAWTAQKLEGLGPGLADASDLALVRVGATVALRGAAWTAAVPAVAESR
ncbi:hypothetical protein BCD48_09300 [Pseudofrankia sp. BMG5.36]|nr:hypothetical protein BCD48_09300 [Pseudofrankia sp. BMG5.36]